MKLQELTETTHKCIHDRGICGGANGYCPDCPHKDATPDNKPELTRAQQRAMKRKRKKAQ